LAYERIWPLVRLAPGDVGKHAQRRAVATMALAKGA
jgi:hypothetical protein